MPPPVPRSGRDGLHGVRVAVLESRMAGELAELVRRYGGNVRSAPAVRETAIDCTDIVADFLKQLTEPARRVFVFLTGAGATTLLEEVGRQGRLPSLLASLKRSTIVCRGPKPTAALKRYGINPTVSAASPYTSNELLDALAGIDLTAAEITVVHYGERSALLADALRRRGARLNELCVYEWHLPEDVVPLEDLVQSIFQREVDAIIFTSQVQWKHLLEVASALGLADSIVAALKSAIVVAAVGPVCAAALAESGVHPQVVPGNPKMGPLVAELARYFAETLNRRSEDQERQIS